MLLREEVGEFVSTLLGFLLYSFHLAPFNTADDEFVVEDKVGYGLLLSKRS